MDHGLPVPWVDLAVPEAETLREERTSLDEHLDELEEGTVAFCRVLCRRNVVWKQEAQLEAQAWMPLFSLLEAFYRQRVVPYDQRLVLHPSGRFTVHGGMLQPARDAATQARKLTDYQEEMLGLPTYAGSSYKQIRFPVTDLTRLCSTSFNI